VIVALTATAAVTAYIRKYKFIGLYPDPSTGGPLVPPPIAIRYMQDHDLRAVTEIDNLASDGPWPLRLY